MTGTPIGQVHYATDGRDLLVNDPDGWEIDAPWLWWDGPAGGDGTGGPWGNPPPGAEYGAPTMRGTSLPAVTRCTSLLADPIAGMPWKVYRGRDLLATPAWITDPQALRVDGRRPLGMVADVRLTGVAFWTQVITSMLLWGEGIVYTPRVLDDQGEPTGPIVAPIYCLHPRYVEVGDDGRWYVEDPDTGAEAYLDPRELIVIPYLMRPGRRRGLGVIQAHAADLNLSANLRRYLDNLFARGVPNGYLKSSKPDLTQAAANNLKRAWMSAHGDIRKSIAVLNATTEFHPMDLDPQALAMIDLLRLQAWQVALMFGVPTSKLGINMGGSDTYANLESTSREFVQDSLLPIARRIEAALDPLFPAGTEVKVDFNQLLRGDTATRYAAYQVGLSAGFLTLDEVRSFEDLPPLPPDVDPADAPPDPAAGPAPATDPTSDDVAPTSSDVTADEAA